MAPSFRDLIDFLLAEIALCGDQGASPAEVLSFIDAFYNRAPQDAVSGGSNRRPIIDRQLQERVWTWLTRHPEVSVGKNKEWNGLTLAQVESDEQPESINVAAEEEVKPSLNENTSPRVFVSEERTWLAIAGHEPDESRVPGTEFALLSIIASRKSQGIVQTELVRLSGQDKRSVPKRTDALHKKGYIEKRAIQVKSSRTSLCTLWKFVSETPLFSNTETPADRGPKPKHEDGDIIDFKVFIGRLFEVLKQYNLIARNDLKRILGFADGWRWRILSRALRRLERIGCLKRVKARSQYQDTMDALHPCVLFIREPTERDLDRFHEDTKILFSNLEQETDNNAELDEDVDADTTGQGSSGSLVVKEEAVDEGGRTLPQWTPDRNIHNLIFSIIDGAGTAGRTNADTIRIGFGGFFRRPLENTVSRLVECWQFSQPPHLRHLALVRDTAVSRTVTYYVHYSAKNFKKLVDTGAASWEAVEFVPKDAQSGKFTVPPVDVVPDLDEYGLHPIDPSADFIRKGDATLLECVAAAKPADYLLSSRDPVAVLLRGGNYTVRYRSNNIPASAKRRVAGPTIKPLGRPKGSQNKETSQHPDAVMLVPAKRAPNQVELDDRLDGDAAIVLKRPRLSKRNPERFIGMSEKERLEALGLDETWTEYNVFLIERPGPGVYITPRGRRRPAGKRQGRPKISRIAIFKSPKLQSLSWFVEEAAEQISDAETVDVETPVPAPVVHDEVLHPPSSSDGLPHPVVMETVSQTTPSRRGKRTLQEDGNIITTQESTVGGQEGPPPKRQRTDGENGEIDSDMVMPDREPNTPFGDASPRDSAHQSVVAEHGKRAPEEDVDVVDVRSSTASTRADDSQKEQRSRVQVVTSTSKPAADGDIQKQLNGEMSASRRGRRGRPVHNRMHDVSSPLKGTEIDSVGITEVSPVGALEISMDESVDPERVATSERKSPHIDSTTIGDEAEKETQVDAPTIISSTEVLPEVPSREASRTPRSRKKKVQERGGSVAVLRRKIIMDIVESCGGVFPSGTELWYPFVTAWLKHKYTEKPDFRTVRATLKNLVDAGKLRQLTFSGKDRKGVMVTKTIITKPEVLPDDARVKDLQHKMLTSEARFYIPLGCEVDPTLTKSGRGLSRTFGSVAKLPLEPGVTVQLHQKPAFVVAQEKRKGLSIQRRLLQAIGANAPGGRRPKRLMTIQRPPGQDPSAEGMTSISRPRQRRGPPSGQQDQIDGRVARIGRIKRTWRPISTMAPYAMLMDPKQRFHAPTGTFSCDAGLSAYLKPDLREKKILGPLPRSLAEIFRQAKPHKAISADVPDPRSSKFFADNDVISRWERENAELFDARNNELVYINQTMPGIFETVPIEGGIRFEIGGRAPKPIPQPRATRQVSALASKEAAYSSGVLQPPVSPSRIQRAESFEEEELDQPLPRQPVRRPIARRSRFAGTMPEALVRKLMNTIVVVRTLAGGVEGKIVDWDLVATAFPDYEPRFVIERGKAIVNRSRLQIAKMQMDFQERFIEAYERDEVPRIDYDNLESYDWGKVAEWAESQVDIPASQRVPDLPATREEFDDLFDIREEVPSSSPLDQIFTNNPVAAVGKKRGFYAGVPFAISLEAKTKGNVHKQKQAELSRLDSAKTWIRANVVAREETYDPVDARYLLARFPQPLIDDALQSLITERVIGMTNRGRTTPGRNFNLTDVFYQSLGRKRAIDSAVLRRAARFKKEILDEDFRQQGYSEVRYNAHDGDILAIINLAAARQVIVKAYDPPREMYGLTDGGYETRVIAKDKFKFTVHVRPVRGTYQYGNPVRGKTSSVPLPRGDMDLNVTRAGPGTIFPVPSASSAGFPGRVPVWFDVNGRLVKSMWDKIVAAVVGIVAVRPGVDPGTIANMIKPTVGTWEVQLVLEWLAEVGVVARTHEEPMLRPGWMVKEWWWLVLE